MKSASQRELRFLFSSTLLLKNVLQCELHDSRISGSLDLTEVVVRQDQGWIKRIQMVWQIERFCPEFEGLAFPNLKRSSQTHVDTDASRTLNIQGAQISKRAGRGLSERS